MLGRKKRKKKNPYNNVKTIRMANKELAGLIADMKIEMELGSMEEVIAFCTTTIALRHSSGFEDQEDLKERLKTIKNIRDFAQKNSAKRTENWKRAGEKMWRNNTYMFAQLGEEKYKELTGMSDEEMKEWREQHGV